MAVHRPGKEQRGEREGVRRRIKSFGRQSADVERVAEQGQEGSGDERVMLSPERGWRPPQRAGHKEGSREHIDIGERDGRPEPPAMPVDRGAIGPNRHRRPHGQVPLVGGRDEDGGDRDEPQRNQVATVSEPADAGVGPGKLQPQRRRAGDTQVLKFGPEYFLLGRIDEPVACTCDTPPRHGSEQPHQRPGSRR